MGYLYKIIIINVVKMNLHHHFFCKTACKRQFQFIGLTITLLLALASCVTNLPEYISSTPAEKIPEIIALFNNEQKNIAVEYPGAYILPIKPEKYYEQNVPYCGGFSVAGILSAYHMDVN